MSSLININELLGSINQNEFFSQIEKIEREDTQRIIRILLRNNPYMNLEDLINYRLIRSFDI